jgi:hypothetical protein
MNNYILAIKKLIKKTKLTHDTIIKKLQIIKNINVKF